MKLDAYDQERVVRRLPRFVKEVMKNDQVSFFMAGGFIRAVISGEDPADIDLFVSSEADAKQLVSALKYHVSGRRHRVVETKNATTLDLLDGSLPIQIVHRWVFATPQECIASFDFTVASAALWYDKTAGKFESCCDETFYQDLAARRLRYRNPVRNEDVGGSLLRLLKFHRAGYSAPLTTVADVCARLYAGIKPEQLGTMPPNEIILGLLYEVDPRVAPELARTDVAGSESDDA